MPKASQLSGKERIRINQKRGKKRTGRPMLNSPRIVRALTKGAVRCKGATARSLGNNVGAKGTKQTICNLVRSKVALKCFGTSGNSTVDQIA